MKHTLRAFALTASTTVIALIGVASPEAAPVTSDDLVKAQDNAKEWLTYGRDYRNWRYSPLSEITPDTVVEACPGVGDVHRRAVRRAGGDRRCSATAFSTSPPTTRAFSPWTPNPATYCGATSPNTGRASTPCCAAARSIAAWR